MYWWEKLVLSFIGLFLFDRWVLETGLFKKSQLSPSDPKIKREEVGQRLDVVGGYAGTGRSEREKEREKARERREKELRKREVV